MDGHYMIGIDIGTTSTKAVLFQENGKVVAKADEGYPLFTPVPDAAEQDPDQIFRAVILSLKRVMEESGVHSGQVLFVSFSSAMHSVIAVDAGGKPLTRCITWGDNRSAEWAGRLKREMNGHQIYLRTGTPIHPMSPLPKLMWLRHERPDLFRPGNKFVSIKEYVLARIFGEFVVDHSIASATGMMNLQKLDWDEEALAAAGVTRDQLSRLVPTTHVLTGMNAAFSAETGLAGATPFIVGASDGVLSNLGVNAIGPGVVAATIGTSGAIRTVVERPVTDTEGRTFCYALTEKHWVIGGPVNNGGIVLRWARDTFFADTESYDRLMQLAEKVRPGADGLIFHPYLSGERAPLWNANVRGSFFGLALNHGKEHMLRAVLEGVIFNLHSVLLAMEETMGRPAQIQATGGFARSPLWRQMMADIFNQKVVVPESFESSCLGAAVLGLYALGKTGRLDIVSDMVGATHVHEPIPEHADIYRQLLPLYLRISRKMEEEYEALARFRRNRNA